MSLGSVRFPSLGEFRRDTRLLLITSGIISLGIFGIQTLVKVLYILRLGYGLEYVGLFAATPALVFMSMSLPSGALGKKFGLKKMMLVGVVSSTFGMVLLPLTEIMPANVRDAWPIFTQILLMGGWALFEINMVPALMAATTSETRDDAYALMSMLRGAGTFFGTIIGGFLPLLFALMLGASQEGPIPYRWALLVGGAFGVGGMLLLMRITDIEADSSEQETAQSGPFPLKLIAIVVVHAFLIHGGFAMSKSFVSAYMDTQLQLSTAMIGILTGMAQFAAMVAPLFMPALVARRSNSWTMMMAAFGVALFMIPLALIPNGLAAGFGYMGVLAFVAIWMPTQQVFQMNLIEQHWRSLAYGTVAMGMSSSFGITSLIGGVIAATFGYPATFLYGGVMSAAGGGVMWAFRTIPVFRNLALQTVNAAQQTESPVTPEVVADSTLHTRAKST